MGARTPILVWLVWIVIGLIALLFGDGLGEIDDIHP